MRRTGDDRTWIVAFCILVLLVGLGFLTALVVANPGTAGGDTAGGGGSSPVGAADGDGAAGQLSGGDGAGGQSTDSDGDGLADSAERATTGLLADADPMRKDIFVELDYVGTGDPGTIIDALAPVRERFEQAPVDNPDGSRGIDLHFVADEELSAGDVDTRYGGAGRGGHRFDTANRDYRDAGYHYAIVTVNATVRGSWTWIGAGRYGKLFLRTESASPPPDHFMHELGHALGLHEGLYGGIDSEQVSPEEYRSVMNYAYDGPPRYSDGPPFDDWAFIADGFTPGRGGGECPTANDWCPTRSTEAEASPPS